MYTVIFTKNKIGKNDEVTGVPEIRAYHTTSKKLAIEYLNKRFDERSKFMLDKEKTKGKYEFDNCGSKGDGTWANIEYVELDRVGEPGYHHTREEFNLVKSREIIKRNFTGRKAVLK